MQRVSGFVEEDGREVQEIQPGFDQLRMGDYDLYSFFNLSRIPGLAFRRIRARPQNSRPDAFVAQDALQPGSNVVLLRVHGKHLAAAAFGKLLLDLLDQLPFLGMQLVFGKISCFRDDESNVVSNFGIKFRAIQRS